MEIQLNPAYAWGFQVVHVLNELQKYKYPLYSDYTFLRIHVEDGKCKPSHAGLNKIPAEILSRVPKDCIIGDIGTDQCQSYFLVNRHALDNKITVCDVKLVAEYNSKNIVFVPVGFDDVLSIFYHAFWIYCPGLLVKN